MMYCTGWIFCLFYSLCHRWNYIVNVRLGGRMRAQCKDDARDNVRVYAVHRATVQLLSDKKIILQTADTANIYYF